MKKGVFWRKCASLGVFGVALAVLGLTSQWRDRQWGTSKPLHSVGHEGREEAGGPMDAFKWRRMAWLDHGKLDPAGFQRALTQKRLMHHVNSRVAGDQWVEQGPTNIAGRTLALLSSPTDPNTLFIGTAGGGVWKSTDGGQVWNPVGQQMAALSIGCLAVDPNHPTTLYAGTGEAYFNLDAIGGDGIYKSTDNGETWTKLAGTTGTAWLGYNVESIAIDPTNSNNLLVAGVGNINAGFQQSTDGGSSFHTTFTSAYCGDVLEFSRTDSTKVVGTYLDPNTGLGKVVISADSGATWTPATTQPTSSNVLDRVVAKFSPTSSSTIIAATDTNSAGAGGGFWTSTDGGKDFSVTTTSGDFQLGSENQFWYDFTLWIDPTNPNRLVVGGVGVYESTDGGKTVNTIGDGYNSTTGFPHPDVHFVAASSGYNGTTNKMVYVCCDGGVFQVPDVTTVTVNSGWNSLNFTATTAQYYSVAGDATAGTMIGGTQDNGTHLLNVGQTTADRWVGGDGFSVAMDPMNAKILYGEFEYLRMYSSQDNGVSANYIYSGITDVDNGNANFVAPFMLDPNNHETLLAGGASLWRTTNATTASPSWTNIRPGANPVSSNEFLTTIAVAPGNSNVIWVGQNDGTVAMTTNGLVANPTWKTVSSPSGGPLPSNRMCTKILVDPADSNTVYATFGGFTSNNVWKSSDGGTSWSALNGSGSGMLPQVPVRTIARNPSNAQVLYLGTEVGIFSSSNGGSTWSVVSDGPANTSVYDLEYMNNPVSNKPALLAGTHGRGMWLLENGISVSSVTFSPSTVAPGATATGTVTLNAPAPAGADVFLQTSDNNATVPVEVTVPAGKTSATFTIDTTSITGTDTETISAEFGLSSASGNLLIGSSGPLLKSLSINPPSVIGGRNGAGVVVLKSAAPSAYPVTLTSQFPSLVGVPPSVTVPAGATQVSFSMTTKAQAQVYSSVIRASDGTNTATASLTVDPNGLAGFTLSPSVVYSSHPSTATVTLVNPAPTGGWKISASSQYPALVGVPSAVTVPAGSSSTTFIVATVVNSQQTLCTIALKDAYSNKSAVLTVDADGVMAINFSPPTVSAGQTSTGTVHLNHNAPAGGWVVNLTSQFPNQVKVPPSVTVLAGQSAVNFTATTVSYNSTFTCNVTGKDASGSAVGTLTVDGVDSVAGLSFAPGTVNGGASSVGTITLKSAAPTGGWTVKLSSSNTNVKVPSSVTVPAGSTTATFTATTANTGSAYSSTVKVYDAASSASAVLYVN